MMFVERDVIISIPPFMVSMAASQWLRGVHQKESVVRGQHVYKISWTPTTGEELPLEREESNQHDEQAVGAHEFAWHPAQTPLQQLPSRFSLHAPQL